MLDSRSVASTMLAHTFAILAGVYSSYALEGRIYSPHRWTCSRRNYGRIVYIGLGATNKYYEHLMDIAMVRICWKIRINI